MPTVEALEKRGLGGTNCKLAFQSNDGSFSTDVRVRKLAHTWEVIATESHARENRAMYPRQRAVGRFALTIELKGYPEFSKFMDFMRSYVYAWRLGGKPMMLVTMAVRAFQRQGVPITGMSIGDHVGSMVFSPTIVFESAADPQDPTILAPGATSTTEFGAGGDARSFFYPFSPGSEDTNVQPETVYDFSKYGNSNPGLGGVLLNSVQQTILNPLVNQIENALDALGRNNH